MSSMRGAISVAIQHLRDSLEGVLAPFKWALLTADNPFQKWTILSATRSTGFAIVSWKSDATASQAGRSLVIRARLAITVCARMNLTDTASAKIMPATAGAPTLFEMHDRIKGAMLGITMPDSVVPEPGAEILIYGGTSPLSTPDGFPLDALEQTWEVELLESYSPEHTE